MVMIMAGETSLRQVIAFPKTASGTDLMTGSPSSVRDEQMRDLGLLAVRNRKVERLLRGQARILVNRGHLYAESLRAEGISHEELLQALRENGCPTLVDCRLAVLEVDGTISVITAKT